jgi:hypothetical protein
MRPQFWRNACGKEHWITRLFGRICEPSRAALGAAKWIALLGDTRASLSPLPENAKARTIRGICGQLSLPLFGTSDRPSASLRMCGDIYRLDLNKSPESYQQWVMSLKRACLARRKSARAITASGCLYWPTATAMDARAADTLTPKRSICPQCERELAPAYEDGLVAEFGIGANGEDVADSSRECDKRRVRQRSFERKQKETPDERDCDLGAFPAKPRRRKRLETRAGKP